MRSTHRLLVTFLTLGLVAACSTGNGTPPASDSRDTTGADAGTATDAGTAENDAGADADAGVAASYAVGGRVIGLAGTGLTLQNNAGDDLAVSADGTFVFAKKGATGASYAVTVKTQPSSPAQTCAVVAGTGTIGTADVDSVLVDCTTSKFTVGGHVTGLVGSGLVLENAGGDNLHVQADGDFTFSTPVASGGSFAVAVNKQPSSPVQTCVVTGGTGTVVAGNVTSVNVNCSTTSFTVGGTVTGLDGTGLVLQDNAGDDLPINANGTFAFGTALVDGTHYAVTVTGQPHDKTQECTVTSDTGNVSGANVTTVAVTCTTTKFTVGGTVTGLEAGESVTLENNGGDDVTVSQDGSFEFTTSIASGGAYAVTVDKAPAGKTCTVDAGSGTVTTAKVTNVAVTCAVTPKNCTAIKRLNAAAQDGNYVIDPDGKGPYGPLTVYCDMTTDGGGYMSYAVENGISTTRFDQANSCTAVGLKMVIPRTAAHLQALYAKYGVDYFQTVPGVYGKAAGDYTGCAMNSDDPTCGANWVSLDNGSWFVRDAARSEPNGDYTPGCWLLGGSVDGDGFAGFNDAWCNYATGPKYVCSDNAKGAGFAPTQTVAGRVLTCGTTVSTATYAECSNLNVDGRAMINYEFCPAGSGEWSTTIVQQQDIAGLCQTVLGFAPSSVEIFYAPCGATAPRYMFGNGVWNDMQDNGISTGFRCYR